MKALLKTDFRRLSKNKLVYVLLILALVLPAISTGMLYYLMLFLGEGDLGFLPSLASEHYMQSFSLLNNIGLMTMIFVTLIIAKDFSEFTIRNKIIAGYSRVQIYFSVLIINLALAFAAIFLNSTTTYIIALFFEGFDKDSFINVLKFAVIGYTSIIVLFTFNTLLIFKYKKASGAMLLTIGVLFIILIFSGVVDVFGTLNNRNPQFVYYTFPIIRLLSLTGKDVPQWYFALLANAVHLGYMIPLSVMYVKKTDFK